MRTPEEFRLIPIIGSAAGLRQGGMFGLSVDDFDFGEEVIRVRRQVKRLGKEYVFALPKNDKERIVPMSASLARQAVDRRLDRLASRLTERGRSRARFRGSQHRSPPALRSSGGGGILIWAGLFQLGGGLAEEAAGNDQLLDLLGSLEDVEDF